MFDMARTMLTLDNTGLRFGGRTVLAKLSPEGRLDVDGNEGRILTLLGAAYGGQVPGWVLVKLRNAGAKWNAGQPSLAVGLLTEMRLRDVSGDAEAMERLGKVERAFEAATIPDGFIAQCRKAFNPDEPRDEDGRWTTEGDSGDDTASVTDVAVHTSHLCSNRRAVSFVKKYYPQAEAVGREYGVSGEYVIGLAARESGYGDPKSSFVGGNAFFNLERPYPEGTGPTAEDIAAIPHARSAKQSEDKTWNPTLNCYTYSWVYTYDNFAGSARSFLDRYGKYVKGADSPEKFLRALQQGGFNADPKFLDPKVLKQASQRLKCPG